MKSNKKKLSILHTVEYYWPHAGGAELVVQEISERLAARGHSVTVASKKLENRDKLNFNNVKIVEFDVEGSCAYGLKGKDIIKYKEFIKNSNFDVMMNYAAQQWASDLAMEMLGEIKENRVNIITPCGYSALLDANTLRWPQFLEYFNNFLPQHLKKYDASIYHAQNYKDYHFGSNLSLLNMQVIPNAISEDEFTNRADLNFRQKYNIWDQKILLNVANFIPGKGQEKLIEVFKNPAFKDYCLVLIGNDAGSLNELKVKAQGLNVRFLEGLPREDIIAAYFFSDLFVFSSEIEYFPLVILEAMAAGLPFVSTDCGCVRELAGGLVKPISDFKNTILELLNNSELHQKLSFQGRQEAYSRYAWDAVVDKYENLYLNCVEQKKLKGNTTVKKIRHNNEVIQVSLALATKGREEYFNNFLESLKNACEGLSFELLLLDGNIDDQNQEILEKYTYNVVYFKEAEVLGTERHSWPVMYNYLLTKARGKYLIYASDDIIFNSQSIVNSYNMLEENFRNDLAGSIFFYQNQIPEKPWDRDGIDLMIGGSLLVNYGMIRKDILEKIGYIDNSYKFYCADSDLSFKIYKAGYNIIPAVGASVLHNNVMDLSRQTNYRHIEESIKLFEERWSGYARSNVIPNQRRLLYVPQLKEYYLVPFKKFYDFHTTNEYWKEMSSKILLNGL